MEPLYGEATRRRLKTIEARWLRGGVGRQCVVVVPPQEKEEKALEAWQLEGWTLVDHQPEQAEIAA